MAQNGNINLSTLLLLGVLLFLIYCLMKQPSKNEKFEDTDAIPYDDDVPGQNGDGYDDDNGFKRKGKGKGKGKGGKIIKQGDDYEGDEFDNEGFEDSDGYDDEVPAFEDENEGFEDSDGYEDEVPGFEDENQDENEGFEDGDGYEDEVPGFEDENQDENEGFEDGNGYDDEVPAYDDDVPGFGGDGVYEGFQKDKKKPSKAPTTSKNSKGKTVNSTLLNNASSIFNFEPNDTSVHQGASLNNAFERPVDNNTKTDVVDLNKNNVTNYSAKDYLPKEINDDWFNTDFSQAKYKMNDDKLINTDKYVVGVNTVGQSLKNASYDIRGAINVPKYTISPWNNSTIEPDYNIKPLC